MYNSYSQYLKARYKKNVYRVAVDAGFSCPNRESRENFGCTFCDETGSRASYTRDKNLDMIKSKNSEYKNFPPAYNIESINNQIDRGINFLKKRYNAEIFLLYFQSYSCTNAPTDILKKIYDQALAHKKFNELIVSTRPDCIDNDKAKLLNSYYKKEEKIEECFDVWCELGLQTMHDKTLQYINRGHTYLDFLKSYEILKKYNIKIALHLIFGLPNETEEDMIKTLNEVNRLKPDAIKIHNLHIPLNTPMYQQYLRGEVKEYSYEEHLKNVKKAITILDKDIIIMRFTCDVLSEHRGAPKQIWKKGEFLNRLNNFV